MYKIITTSFVLLSDHHLNLFLHLNATKKNSVFVLEKIGADWPATEKLKTIKERLIEQWKGEVWTQATMKTSEEVGCCCSRWYDPFRVRNGPEQLWLPCVHIFEDHDGGYVTTAVAVVWGWPDGYQLLIKHKFVTLVNQLMCTANQLQVVDVNKL